MGSFTKNFEIYCFECSSQKFWLWRILGRNIMTSQKVYKVVYVLLYCKWYSKNIEKLRKNLKSISKNSKKIAGKNFYSDFFNTFSFVVWNCLWCSWKWINWCRIYILWGFYGLNYFLKMISLFILQILTKFWMKLYGFYFYESIDIEIIPPWKHNKMEKSLALSRILKMQIEFVFLMLFFFVLSYTLPLLKMKYWFWI